MAIRRNTWPSERRTLSGSGVLLACLVTLTGCTEGRSTAAAELLRFERAVQEHVREHGTYPETVDATEPGNSGNLPYRSNSGVTLQILPRADGYEATARYENWTCSMSVGAAARTAPDCFPQ